MILHGAAFAVLLLVGAAAAAQTVEPELNPAPDLKLVIVGEKDARLALSFQVRYASQKDGCRIEKWPHVQTRWETHAVAPAGAREFRAEIPVDKYLPGDCGWRADEVFACPSTPTYKQRGCHYLAFLQLGATLKEAATSLSCRLEKYPPGHMLVGERLDCSIRTVRVSPLGATIKVTASYSEYSESRPQ